MQPYLPTICRQKKQPQWIGKVRWRCLLNVIKGGTTFYRVDLTCGKRSCCVHHRHWSWFHRAQHGVHVLSVWKLTLLSTTLLSGKQRGQQTLLTWSDTDKLSDNVCSLSWLSYMLSVYPWTKARFMRPEIRNITGYLDRQNNPSEVAITTQISELPGAGQSKEIWRGK